MINFESVLRAPEKEKLACHVKWAWAVHRQNNMRQTYGTPRLSPTVPYADIISKTDISVRYVDFQLSRVNFSPIVKIVNQLKFAGFCRWERYNEVSVPSTVVSGLMIPQWYISRIFRGQSTTYLCSIVKLKQTTSLQARLTESQLLPRMPRQIPSPDSDSWSFAIRLLLVVIGLIFKDAERLLFVDIRGPHTVRM